MTEKLPRLNVTVTHEQHALLAQLGKLQGRSSASFLREMLDVAMPFLRASLPVWEAAARDAAEHPGRLLATIQDALADVKVNVAQIDMMALIASTADPSNDPGADEAAPSGARADRSAPARSDKRARR